MFRRPFGRITSFGRPSINLLLNYSTRGNALSQRKTPFFRVFLFYTAILISNGIRRIDSAPLKGGDNEDGDGPDDEQAENGEGGIGVHVKRPIYAVTFGVILLSNPTFFTTDFINAPLLTSYHFCEGRSVSVMVAVNGIGRGH